MPPRFHQHLRPARVSGAATSSSDSIVRLAQARSGSRAYSPLLRQLDNLVQTLTGLLKQGVRNRSKRMSSCTAQAPVEGLGLMTKHITRPSRLAPLGLSNPPRQRGCRRCIPAVVIGRPITSEVRALKLGAARARETDEHRTSRPTWRIAVNPDNVLSIWYPGTAFSGCKPPFWLPTLSPDGFARHDFSAVAHRIVARQSLLQCKRDIREGRDDYLFAFHGNTNPLVNMEAGLARNSRRQANAKIITPLLYVQNSLCHDPLP